jgi:hypothetical protein
MTSEPGIGRACLPNSELKNNKRSLNNRIVHGVVKKLRCALFFLCLEPITLSEWFEYKDSAANLVRKNIYSLSIAAVLAKILLLQLLALKIM